MEWNTFERRLGETIRGKRVQKGKTQEETASALHVKRETVKQWENGERYIKAKDLIKIADFLDVSTDELLGRENDYSSIDPDVGAVFQKTGLPISLFRYIEAWSVEQKQAFCLLLGTPEFLSLLGAVLRCSTAYQKERDLVLQAESQQEGDLMEILTEIPAAHRTNVAGILYRYSSLCQYVMESADDEANHAVKNLQEAATAVGRSLVKKSKAQANKKSIEDWKKEQDDLISRFIESLGKEALTDGNDQEA